MLLSSRAKAMTCLAAGLVLSAACGSTANTTAGSSQPGSVIGGSNGLGGTAGSGGPAASTLTAPGSSGSVGGSGGSSIGGSGGSTSGGTALGSGGGSVGGGAGSGGGSTGSAGAGSGAGTTAGQVGPGVSATEILVGRSRYANFDAAAKAFGSNTASAPTDAYDKAMLDYINGRGGAAGRKIKLNYYTVDATANKSNDQIEGEECAQWTQDNHVYAVLTGGSDNLRGCLAKKGVPQVFENVYDNSDKATFAAFRSYYEINAISLSHLGDVLPDQLATGGYMTPGAKYGLLTFDDNQYVRAVDQDLKPAMSRRNAKFEKEAYVKTPKTSQEAGEAVGSLPNYVLAFKNAGVDHVMVFGDSGGALLAYFSKAAAGQGYHPAYGVTSASAPQGLIDSKNVDPNELKGAVAAGWNPTGDVGVKPYTKYGPGYKLCASIMAKAGVPFNGDINNTVVGTKTCDAFFFFAATVNRGAPNVTGQSFVAAAESLGASYSSAVTYGASISTTFRDGVSVIATTAYDGSCTCFRYKGDLHRIR